MARKNKKKTTLDDLASMAQKGFLDLGGKMDRVERRLINLEEGQEEIKLRLDNVAYRFELVELQKRVDLLEKIILPKAKRSDIMK